MADPTLGTFASASRGPQTPVPPARNTLQALIDWVNGARAMANQDPLHSFLNSITPSLPVALGMSLMPQGGMMNASPPPRGGSLAEQGLRFPQQTVNAHLAQMKPLPNQGVSPTPEVMATKGMPGDAAEAAINAAMRVPRGQVQGTGLTDMPSWSTPPSRADLAKLIEEANTRPGRRPK